MKKQPKKKGPFYGAKVKCLECGTVIQSAHIHDYVSCKCPRTKRDEDQKGISIDGGGDYCRMGIYGNTKYEIIDGGNYLIG